MTRDVGGTAFHNIICGADTKQATLLRRLHLMACEWWIYDRSFFLEGKRGATTGQGTEG
jgi:hypothetical protein